MSTIDMKMIEADVLIMGSGVGGFEKGKNCPYRIQITCR
jgi:hypothetical protein